MESGLGFKLDTPFRRVGAGIYKPADYFVTIEQEQLQRRKIDRLGFTRYFQCVKVVEGKDCAALLDVLASTDFENSKTWVVGDSIRSDINPGIEAGLRCILYHYRHDQYQWTQEYGAKAIGAFYVVERLDAVRSVLENPSAHRMVDQLRRRPAVSQIRRGGPS